MCCGFGVDKRSTQITTEASACGVDRKTIIEETPSSKLLRIKLLHLMRHRDTSSLQERRVPLHPVLNVLWPAARSKALLVAVDILDVDL